MSVDFLTLFGAGLLTLGSPCILPLIPIYLGMLMGSSLEAVKEPGGRFKLLTSTLAFVLGFGLVFTLLGLGASSIGVFLQAHRQTMLWVGGLLIVLFGLKFLHVIKLSFLEQEHRFQGFKTGNRLLDAAIFGVVFALGWTPCVGPLLGSVLTYTASKTTDPMVGALYLGIYSLGIGTPLLILGAASDRLLPLLRKLNQHIPTIEKFTGYALVGVGVWLIASSNAVPGFDPDVPPGPSYTVQGVEVKPHLGEPTKAPRLVEFFTKSCPTCKKMAPRVEALRQECTGKKIEVLQIDASDPRNRAVARRYKISVVPTFTLLAPDGREIRRLVGEMSEQELRQAAAALIEDTCGGEPFLPIEELQSKGENVACQPAADLDMPGGASSDHPQPAASCTQ